MSTEERAPASPACLAHEADDTYMGFASPAEITVFLRDLAEAERAGRPYREMLREFLPRVRDDALYQALKARLETPGA